MKTVIQLSILTLSFLLLHLPSVFSQNGETQNPPFEVQQTYPYISVSKTQLAEANTLQDLKNNYNHLHLEYKPTWVEKYISVEIQVCQDGELKKATGTNDQLTKEQKDLLANADAEKEIQVNINYWPKNNLVHNESKTINFSLSINPENSATYPGGTNALNQFLEENAIGKIPANSFQNYDLAAIKFNISPSGLIDQASIFGAEYQAGKFDAINQQLLAAIRKMPRWQPATYADGTQTSQAFVLAVGSKENCILPLLNTKNY